MHKMPLENTTNYRKLREKQARTFIQLHWFKIQSSMIRHFFLQFSILGII